DAPAATPLPCPPYRPLFLTSVHRPILRKDNRDTWNGMERLGYALFDESIKEQAVSGPYQQQPSWSQQPGTSGQPYNAPRQGGVYGQPQQQPPSGTTYGQAQPQQPAGGTYGQPQGGTYGQ